MEIRDVQFQKVWCGSGVLGFVGEGYWWTKFSGLSVTDPKVTFVTKTITIEPNSGNVRLNTEFRPKRFLPETLKINFLKGIIINRFALSNPGLEAILNTRKLQQLKNPFFISVGTVSSSAKERLKDFQKIKERLGCESFESEYGIQINFSCPNISKGTTISIEEKKQVIKIFSNLSVPITIKLAPETPEIEFIELTKEENLDAFVFSNTRQTRTGGLSGTPLKNENLQKIQDLRRASVKKIINAGGGILSKKDAQHYLNAGADCIFIWSVTLLRPWRVKSILSLSV